MVTPPASAIVSITFRRLVIAFRLLCGPAVLPHRLAIKVCFLVDARTPKYCLASEFGKVDFCPFNQVFEPGWATDGITDCRSETFDSFTSVRIFPKVGVFIGAFVKGSVDRFSELVQLLLGPVWTAAYV